ncbi:MAG: molecular chaperone TorD family protein [Coriobacteriales bacterium]|nr:molecular chaperone TorD family protein [Coriobacteriales bacterium]
MEKPTAEDILAAQVSFEFVAALVHDEPTTDMLNTLREESALDEAPFGNENENVKRGLALMRGWLATNIEEAADHELAGEWLDLLIGRGEPKAPCWESYYTEPDRRLYSQNSIDIKKAFREHGAQLQTSENEPVDHLGILLRFVAFLMAQEINALNTENHEQAEWYAKSQKEFLSTHVLPWLSSWFTNVQRSTKNDFYLGVSYLLFGIVQSYVERFGIYYYSTRDVFE